jgi:hypothetical protein
MNDWYESLRSVRSLGSQVESPGSLAGLHDARRVHMGQFFTPDAVAAFMWGLVKDELDLVSDEERGLKASVLDTSVGSGRLLQFCSPSKHIVGGVDIHEAAISQVKVVFEAAGFECNFKHAGMEEIRAHHWTLAMLNPPFTLHLESPLLEPYVCTSYGRFGPRTSAQSDYYAISQALESATGVVALVPRTVAEKVWEDASLVDLSAVIHKCDEDPGRTKTRLRARFDLPRDSFKEEGAVVEVSVLVFGYGEIRQCNRRLVLVRSLSELITPALDLGLCRSSDPKIRHKRLEDAGPAITLPVTGNNEVRVAHDGRKIKLKFGCGFTQARVLNAVLRERIFSTSEHRLPAGFSYSGQGQLDIQVHLLQDDPVASVRELLDLIERQDATVNVDRGFWPYIQRCMRRHQLAATPLAHTVWRKGVGARKVIATCKKVLIVDRKSWASPVINEGDVVEFVRSEDGRFETMVGDYRLCIGFEELSASFAELQGAGESGWVQVHSGLLAAKPRVAQWWRKRLEKSIVNEFLTWSFQKDDLIELLMCPRGAIAGWSMGLGKTRLAIALILLSGVRHGLVTLEAYLVPEFVDQLSALNLPSALWQVIKTPEDLVSLRTINIVSDERLRMRLPGSERVTYAHRLRRRIGMAISDEGDFLANPRSDRSRAVWRVSAQRRYVLTGTICPNYPRDVLPIMTYVAGDATAAQPWGYHGPYLEQNHIKSVAHADRGIAKFIDTFVTLEWVTNEFADTLREGAKREVPKISNLNEYRAMLAPHVKRRVSAEPEVCQHVKIPVPDEVVHTLNWDLDHLGHYVRVADEFASWMGGEATRKKNLLVILLRFQAVLRALNMPQIPSKHVKAVYNGVTSKQRFIVDRLETLANEGHKTLLYVHSPDLAKLLAKRLQVQTGIEPVLLHGGISIAKRHKMLRERFKQGVCPTVIATFGVTQAGHNIPQADRVLLGNRDWTAKVERQSIARALRPETDHPVTVEYVHLIGGADEYQAQMVRFKAAAADEGLDWATPEFEEEDFLHLDTILGRFCDDLAARRGMKAHELREELKVYG